MSKSKIKLGVSGGILFSVFLILSALKITAVIDWSWWVVCVPLYPIALSYLFILVVFLLYTMIIIEDKLVK